MLKHISQIAKESGIAEKIKNPIIAPVKQPERCPWCNAERIAIDGALHVFKCATTIFIWPGKIKKPLARRSRVCMEGK